MSENIMCKNIAEKMKQESLETIRDSYDETMPKQEFERSLKYIEDYITDLQADIQELQDAVVWWNNRYNALQRDYEDYKSRCEKEIEYIQNHQLVFELSSKKVISQWFDMFYKDSLNILNGRSDE